MKKLKDEMNEIEKQIAWAKKLIAGLNRKLKALRLKIEAKTEHQVDLHGVDIKKIHKIVGALMHYTCSKGVEHIRHCEVDQIEDVGTHQYGVWLERMKRDEEA